MATDLLSKMATFVRVVDAGSLAAAAKQLHVSSAAVSRQLAVLEREVGAELIARTTRRMTVTPRGRNYYESCLRVLRAVDDAHAAAPAALAGPIRVSAPVTFGLASVVPHLRALVAAAPALRLDIRLEDAIVDLALAGVDIAIRVAAAPPATTEIVAREIYAWRRILVAAPAYLARRGVPRTPAALARHEAVAHAIDRSGDDAWVLEHGARRERVRPAIRCASNAGHAVRDLALDGLGIAMLPPWFVAGELARGALRVVLPGWGSELFHAHALYRAQHRHETRVRSVVDHLRAAYAAQPA